MDYIQIDPKTLELSFSDREPEKDFLIPTHKSKYDVLERGFHGLVYFNVLYPYVKEEDEAKGKQNIAYSLVEPDPWLVTIAAIMWQGLIQGLTWDIIKLAVLKGLDFLKMKKLATVTDKKITNIKQDTESRLEVGFSWTKFNQDGEPLQKFFLGIQREFKKKRNEERESIKRQYKKIFNI